MARYKAIVSYDGSRYAGWQKQPNVSSIQEEIEKALYKIHGEHIEITASGRTDAKVHALGQVFHFDSQKNMKPSQYQKALNSLLNRDIRILHIEAVDDDFHARFSAKKKRYDYYVTSDIFNPFIQNYMGKDTYPLDIEKMKQCANIFIGAHDFTSFTSNKIDPRKPREKTITRIDIIQENNCIHMIFEGTGFLRYMVRMIAQTLIEAGKNRLTKDEIQIMLDAKDKHACRYKASPEGLYLVEVMY